MKLLFIQKGYIPIITVFASFIPINLNIRAFAICIMNDKMWVCVFKVINWHKRYGKWIFIHDIGVVQIYGLSKLPEEHSSDLA